MNKQTIIKTIKWFFGIMFSLILIISCCLFFFKDDIIGLVLKEVNKHLKAKVSVSKVDLTFWKSFPDLSVDFNHVFIQDSYENSTASDTLFYTDLVRLRFSPIDVWREKYHVKQVDINPGTLQLKINSKGITNYDILKEIEDSTVTQPFDLKLEAIEIEDLRFAYTNMISDQKYLASVAKMDLSGEFSESEFTLSANSELVMKEAKSGQINLLRNKKVEFDLSILVNQKEGVFKIPDATLLVANLPLKIRGEVNPKMIDFSIVGNRLPLQDVATHLSMNELAQVKRFQGAGTASIDLRIVGENKINQPIGIVCKFDVANGKLIEPLKQQQISNIELQGFYSNLGDTDKELLSLEKISFQTATGPFSGNLLITNFHSPVFQGNANGKLNLSVIHALFHIPSIGNIAGNLGVDSEFDIQLLPQPNESTNYSVRKCNGSANFEEVAFQLVDDKRLFEHINGKILLNENNISVKDLRLVVAKSDLELNGTFSNIVPFLSNEGSLVADVNVTSNRINLEDLGTTSKEVRLQESPTYILPNNVNATINLAVGDLGYEGHRFELINSRLTSSNRVLVFQDLTFRNAGATVRGAVKIEERSPEVFSTTLQLASNNIVLKSVFKEWNNFNQSVIKEENIFGNAAVNLTLEAPFDLSSGINYSMIKSDVQIKIQDGRLKDVSAFKSITQNLKTPSAKLALGAKNIVALEQKLGDLRFETLENQLIIRNGMIQMPAMIIKSSALQLEVSGKHSFANDIDYRFAFRFRDLKEKKDTEFGNVVDDGTGMIVYMRMHGNLANPIIEWDKASSKEDRKEYNMKEKENMKAMLKSDFGLFGKDTTVSAFKKAEKPKAVLEVQFGKDTTSVDDFVKEKKKKDGKLNKWLKTMEEESKSQKKIEVGFD